MARTKAYRRFQRAKRIRKYQELCSHYEFAGNYEKTKEALGIGASYGRYGKGEEARKKYEAVRVRFLARTHTPCSCFLCQKDEKHCGPSISTQRRLNSMSFEDDYYPPEDWDDEDDDDTEIYDPREDDDDIYNY